MPRISIENYDTVASWNGSQDLFVVEQSDGTKVATPAMVKQFIEAGDFTATGEITDGHGNILKDMAKSADVNTALAGKQDTLTFDNAPTQNSNNPVKSGGIFSALGNKQNVIDQVDFVDSSISWPSSGTDAEKVLSIATQVLNNLSTTKAFSMISIKDGSTLLGEMIYGRITSRGYGKGIFMSYYIDGIYRVKNKDGTVTVARLAEV